MKANPTILQRFSELEQGVSKVNQTRRQSEHAADYLAPRSAFEDWATAEIIDDVLEQAQELLAAKYVGPSCVVAGVALETTLKKLCDKNSIAHAKLDKMNADLAKAGVYNVGVQKQVTAWAHWRNDAAHGTWNTFTEQDVSDMIKGVQRFIADYL